MSSPAVNATRRTSARDLLEPALRYFGLVFGAGFVLGLIRVPLLVPRLGERWAELAEMPLMLIVIIVVARRIVTRHAPAMGVRPWLLVGLIALALLLAAEFMLAVLLAGRSVADYLASRDPVSGSAYLASLVLFALMPSLAARARR